jgi:hypothetical protein
LIERGKQKVNDHWSLNNHLDSVSIKRATIPDIPPIEYTVETFNLNTGDLLHKIRLASLVILGFWVRLNL